MAFGAPAGRGNDFWITVNVDAATAVDRWVWTAPRKAKLLGIQEVHSVVGGASAAVRPRRITASATAPGATAGATVLELTAANISLTATANVVQEPALSATASDLIFDEDDRLALDFSGTVTGLVGCAITFHFLAL